MESSTQTASSSPAKAASAAACACGSVGWAVTTSARRWAPRSANAAPRPCAGLVVQRASPISCRPPGPPASGRNALCSDPMSATAPAGSATSGSTHAETDGTAAAAPTRRRSVGRAGRPGRRRPRPGSSPRAWAAARRAGGCLGAARRRVHGTVVARRRRPGEQRVTGTLPAHDERRRPGPAAASGSAASGRRRALERGEAVAGPALDGGQGEPVGRLERVLQQPPGIRAVRARPRPTAPSAHSRRVRASRTGAPSRSWTAAACRNARSASSCRPVADAVSPM